MMGILTNGKNLYIDASHPNETRIVLNQQILIEEYEYEISLIKF